VTKPTTECEFPKCRNVGRKDWELVDEEGTLLCETEIFMFVCRKHLIEAIEEAAEIANAKHQETSE